MLFIIEKRIGIVLAWSNGLCLDSAFLYLLSDPLSQIA